MAGIVHVVTHGCCDRPSRRPSMFGIHRVDSRGASTSYVLAFERVDHAMALARGLEAYRRTRGRFPARDSDAIMELARLPTHEGVLRHVAVDALTLDDLADRLAGTGIVLSLLTAVGEDHGYAWKDMSSDDQAARVARLNAAWYGASNAIVPFARGCPALLPKPAWPPVKAAAALGTFIIAHMARFWHTDL